MHQQTKQMTDVRPLSRYDVPAPDYRMRRDAGRWRHVFKCVMCSTEFVRYSTRTKTCSKECSKKYTKKQAKKYQKEYFQRPNVQARRKKQSAVR